MKNNIKTIIADILVLVFVVFGFFVRYPYYVYMPGGLIALDERIYINDEHVNTGNYNMAYVSVSKASLFDIGMSYLINDWDLKKEEEVVFKNTDYETTLRIEKIDYASSVNSAIIAAYSLADKKVEIKDNKLIVYGIAMEADTNLTLLDEIISIDGVEYSKVEDVRKYISTKEEGDIINLKVKNNGVEYDRYAKVFTIDGVKLIGMSAGNIFSLETDPKISITTKDSEAGSSGGLMLTLAIYDSIMDEDISHGKIIAGTGTIDADGNVGEIGGVKYKMLGAKKADVFFIPEDNYDEAKEVYDKYKLNFDLVKVSTLNDAITYLNNIK